MGSVNTIDSFQTQKSRIALEDQYGIMAADPSWLQFGDLRIVPKPVYETEAVAGSGDILPSGNQVIDAYTNVEVSGQASYNGLMFPFSSAYGYPTTTIPGGGTDSREHLWTWDGRTEILPPSFSLHYGIPGRAREMLGLVFNTLSLTISRSGMDFGAGGFAKELTPGVIMGGTTNAQQTITITGGPSGGTFTLTYLGFTTAPIAYNAATTAVLAALQALPSIGAGNVAVTGTPGTTYVVEFTGRLGGRAISALSAAHAFTGGTTPDIAVAGNTVVGSDDSILIPNVPFSPLKFNVYVDDAWADLGQTRWKTFYSVGFEVGERFARAMTLTDDQSGDGIYNAEEQEHTINFRLGADIAADSLYLNAKSGQHKFIRIEGTGPIIEGAIPYYFRKDICFILSETDGYDSENGIHIVDWTGRFAIDPVSGNAVETLLRNKVTGLR